MQNWTGKQMIEIIHRSPSPGKRLLLLLLPALFLAAAVILFPSRPSQAQEVDPLDNFIREALLHNPELNASEAQWHLYQRKIIPSGSLDDPRLSLALNNYPIDTFSWNETPMTGQVVKISQNLPFPGKLGTKAEIAGQLSLWYRRAYEENRVQLVRQIKEAWFNLYLVERMIEKTDASLAHFEDVIRVIENRYETGKGMQQEVLKAQVERSILMERRFNLLQQQKSAAAMLNRLRNRAPDETITVPSRLDLTEMPYGQEELVETGLENRPRLKAYQALKNQYAAQKKLARLNTLPDFSVGAAYTLREENRQDNGVDFASLEFSLNIPIFREKRNEEIAEAMEGEKMAGRQLEDFLNRMRANIYDEYAKMEKNRTLTLLYRTGIIPQATQSLEASMSGYQVGKTGFTPLLDSVLTLYRYEIEYFRAVAEHEQSVARLEAEAGLNAVALSGGQPPDEPAGQDRRPSPATE